MKRRIDFAFVSLLLLMVISTFSLRMKPAATYPDPESWLYYKMMGVQTSNTGLDGLIQVTSFREKSRTPFVPAWDTVFSDPWPLEDGWVLNLTIPHETFVTVEDYYYEETPIGGQWVKYVETMEEDGYGWLFLNDTGDVDYYTYSNNAGSYWLSPSSQEGALAAEPLGYPFPGPDGVAGTADDGFGDGVNDPPGSSILYMKTIVTAYIATTSEWTRFFTASWLNVWTTGVAYNEVNEPSGSPINGMTGSEEGQPWEFLAGLDHSGAGPVSESHPSWNGYVTYASAWSQHNIEIEPGSFPIPMGPMDLQVMQTLKFFRDDLKIADIDCNEKVDIRDITIVAMAFGCRDLNLGEDGEPWGGDDKTEADDNWNPQADVNDPRGLIDIRDITTIAMDFGRELTP